MASIFRATDERTGQPVAIKIPHPEMEADPVFYDRFQREQEIGQKLDHPGVMKVFRRTSTANSTWPWSGWMDACFAKFRAIDRDPAKRYQ